MNRLPITTERDPLSPWTRAVLALLQGLLPAMTAIVGGLWIAFTYLEQQRQAQADANDRAKREAATQLVQAQRPFLEKQLALYFEAAQVAGKLVGYTPDDGEWSDAERRFWMLYWSELSMVEDRHVEDAMVTFSKSLSDYTTQRKAAKDHNQAFDDGEHKGPLDTAALALAHAIRKSIEAAWHGNVQVEKDGTR